jgi:hypothetical protein
MAAIENGHPSIGRRSRVGIIATIGLLALADERRHRRARCESGFGHEGCSDVGSAEPIR